MSYRPESDIQLVRFELSEKYIPYIYSIKKMDNKTNLFIDSIETKRVHIGSEIIIDM